MTDEPSRRFREMYSRRELRGLAGSRSFERGVEYAEEGLVRQLKRTRDRVSAEVIGTMPYQVELRSDSEVAEFNCSCPVGERDEFCKHAVAVALIATDAVAADNTGRSGSAEDVPEIDVVGYLMNLDRHHLVELLMERAAADPMFATRLRLATTLASGGTQAHAQLVSSLRWALDRAFETGDFVSYDEAYDYTSGVVEVLDSLQGVLDDGHAEAVMLLTEHAADLACDALDLIDDSDGGMSEVADRIRQLHLAACTQLKPDPIVLASTLFRRELDGDELEIFYDSVSRYADVLGEEGLAEYRRLAQSEWDQLPPLGPEDSKRVRGIQPWIVGEGQPGVVSGEKYWNRFRLEHIMLALAELGGDVDETVAILARDQSGPYQFVKIAEALTNAGRHGEALEWALKGLELHGYGDHRLVEAAADEYHRAEKPQQAVEAMWAAYEHEPSLQSYQRLAEHAQRAGLWPDWRERALTLLRERVNTQDQIEAALSAARGWSSENSTLVAALLFDGDVEQAWMEAQKGGCRTEQWLELARLRESTHPDDAIPIWQEEISRQINQKNNDSYRAAVKVIERIEPLMEAAGRGQDFAPYVASVRQEHRLKRNLMKLFVERGW